MRSILRDAIYRKQRVQLYYTFYSIALGTCSFALLGNGIFYSISRDHKQPIKRSEFNKVLYNTEYNPSSREFQE